MNYRHTRVVIVGAGINGLCAAWRLAQHLPAEEITLVDAFPVGHLRGSSHGEERITRTAYARADWAQRMAYAHRELWPELEALAEEPLVHRGGDAVFWGPESGPIADYASAVTRAGSDVDVLEPADARRRFPDFTFADARLVLHDRTAGVIAAGRTVRALERWLARVGVQRLTDRIHLLKEDERGLLAQGTAHAIRASAAVVTAGPWVRELIPSMAAEVTPVRQHVGYWQMPMAAGRTPAWVYLGPEGLHYGLPTIAGGELKAAFHRTGRNDAPDDPAEWAPPDRAELNAVAARLRPWFTHPLGPLLRADTCFYTNAANDEFVFQSTRRVLAVSACSGHAFKLAPVTGDDAAAWAIAALR